MQLNPVALISAFSAGDDTPDAYDALLEAAGRSETGSPCSTPSPKSSRIQLGVALS
jgi:hypothetical protein